MIVGMDEDVDIGKWCGIRQLYRGSGGNGFDGGGPWILSGRVLYEMFMCRQDLPGQGGTLVAL